ncbi:Mechanosensitive channel MscK precursor [Pseudomonas sp. THAF187a]|uniref:mechanosensitive ion channel family protein n=1 Tax=unclassified Pseudomonas TaxID=196821 RepID=UPI0012683136|nr:MULTISPECIES: mechanosensitive ion channel domain-containing protein [unclassified Pseudomonas]QFT22601.1 Mechanosensitive channel MscK precursor [Pseudomonas sp. THAF187a]QFT42788.1 Mechanosensitive channel MscK precursor [Pseudomonas sp. THAF42]
MIPESLNTQFEQSANTLQTLLLQPETYTQIGIVLAIYVGAWLIAKRIQKHTASLGASNQRLHVFIKKLSDLIFPVTAILMLRVSLEISENLLSQGWLVQAALIISVILIFRSVIRNFVTHKLLATMLRWLGIPLLFLHMVGLLGGLIQILESISVNLGNIEISLYGIARVAIFGSILFWLGRVSSRTGRDFIAHQENLDERTREVAAKLFEVSIFFLIFLLLLQIMGINLTTLAVFGGALGVGLGFGLQAIASNFISGIIILLDRSVSIGDYVELEDGRTGIVRELNMRSTTLETYDGKDIVVPNEKFIAEIFTNWTHKDKSQRYRVDFSVAYDSDIRKLIAIIKDVVASHPQVFSGDDVPIEERPDCEIDSFGDSGINMFVEFWMEGVDDGRNRVGGDLLLMILEALQEHGFEIPFPQREVRILDRKASARKATDSP